MNAGLVADICAAAGTDSIFSSSLDWHFGHWGVVLARTSASNA
jgi:hypothetical protein